MAKFSLGMLTQSQRQKMTQSNLKDLNFQLTPTEFATGGSLMETVFYQMALETTSD